MNIVRALRYRLISALFMLFVGCAPVAHAESPTVCGAAEVHTVLRPCDPGDPSSRQLPFKYRLRPPKDAASPTVLFIQGGPGLPGIGHQTWPVPENFGFMQFDPRGIGCNHVFTECGEIPPTTTEMQSADILAVLRERPVAPLLIWASSYGTVLATTLISQLEQRGLPHPSGAIFEGTVGAAYSTHSPLEGYFRQWALLLHRLPMPAQQLLREKRSPLGFSEAVWGRMLQNYLPLGEANDGSNLLLSLLSALPNPEDKFLSMMRELAAEPPLPAEVVRLYTMVACRELFRNVSSADADFVLRRGELVASKPDLCRSPSLPHPFNAAHWPIRNTPIIYVVGESDPVTPTWQAYAHLSAEPQTSRLVISVPGGGHESLSLALSDCASRIFVAAPAGLDSVAAVLPSCMHPHTVTRLPGGVTIADPWQHLSRAPRSASATKR